MQKQALTKEYGNIVISCSKSGKLTSTIFDYYTKSVLLDYVKFEGFLLLLDSWGGQKNSQMFDKFVDKEGNDICTRKIIPPGCTPFVQSLDVYFYRQAKILIKDIYNCTY